MVTNSLNYRYCNVCNRKKSLQGYTCGACSRTERRWGTIYKVVTLKHITASSRNEIKYYYPSKELKIGLEYFTKRYNLKMPHSVEHTARVLLICTVFANKGYIEFGKSYLTYLVYLMGGNEAQVKYRDRKKARYLLTDNLTSFVYQIEDTPHKLFSTLLMETQLLEKFIEANEIEITKVYKPQ